MNKTKTLWFALALAVSPAAFADPTSISTGVAPWYVNGNPVIVEDLSQIAPFYWISNFGDGRWVGTASTDASYVNTATDGAPSGSYIFTLDIGALMLGPGTFSLQYAADNIIGWSISDGSLAGTQTCTNCFAGPSTVIVQGNAPYTLTGTFSALSVLTALVTNTGEVRNPMGLIAVGSAMLAGPPPAVPEPSTYAMFALGAAGFAAARYRRNRA